MYIVNIDLTGGLPEEDISKVRECVISCLKPTPTSSKNLKERLKNQLSHPNVMGSIYKCVWVDTLGTRPYNESTQRNYFIVISFRNERNKNVLISAQEIQEIKSLEERCLDIIYENLNSHEKEEIKELRLPPCMKERLCERIAEL